MGSAALTTSSLSDGQKSGGGPSPDANVVGFRARSQGATHGFLVRDGRRGRLWALQWAFAEDAENGYRHGSRRNSDPIATRVL